jgi:hypothetical protein
MGLTKLTLGHDLLNNIATEWSFPMAESGISDLRRLNSLSQPARSGWLLGIAITTSWGVVLLFTSNLHSCGVYPNHVPSKPDAATMAAEAVDD